MRLTLLLFSIMLGFTVQAQNKACDKAELALKSGNLKSANKLVDKCLKDPDASKNPNLLLLKSRIQFAIFKDKSMAEEFPNALKDAMKFAEKAIEENKNVAQREAFKQTHIDYFSELIKINNKEAMSYYNSSKYAKALPLFKKSMYFGLDTISMVYAGECYWALEQWDESIELCKKSSELIYMAVLDSTVKVAGYHRHPFIRLCEYYIKNLQFDSAYLYVKNGRAILPNDPDLSSYTYKLMKFQVDKIPPSYDYLIAIQNGLKDFPFDSFLNHRENSIYIFLLNGMAEAGEQRQFDSLFHVYAESKLEKRKLKQLQLVKKFDIFAGMDNTAFTKAMMTYFVNSNLEKSCYSTVLYYCSKLKPNGTSSDSLAKITPTLGSSEIIEITYRYFLTKNPKDKAMIKSLSDYTSAFNKTTLGYRDLLPGVRLNDLCRTYFIKNPEFPAKAKTYRMRLISETADSGDFRLSRITWTEASKMYPDQMKTLDEYWRKIVENDFRMNYFGSRINPKGKTEKNVPEYAWNGNADSCKWGSMPDDVVLRAQQRINYFRRMAGMSEMISLTKQDNEMCMLAVMMCESNKSMTHNPNDGWRCYVPAGADALKDAILSKDGNPAIAITAAMGQNHSTVGNRRWLLYPNALYMGIGTSKTYTAIKAIDDNRGIDSNKYKNQYVAWPPANACPKMLIFKKWSFSIDLDLNGATISMKDGSGQAVELKQEPYTAGYGMNTIVWEPTIPAASLTDGSVFHVTVKLKSGKTYQYTVKIIDVKL